MSSLLLTSPCLSVRSRALLFLFLLFFFTIIALGVFSVSASWDPKAALSILHGLVLARKVDTLTRGTGTTVLLATLAKVAGTGAEFGGDGRVGSNPVCEGVLAVLDDAVVRRMSQYW